MATAVNSGYGSEIINVAVGTGAWTAITFTRIPNNVLISSRAGKAMKVSLDPSGATYLTIPEGNSLTYDWNIGTLTGSLYIQGTVSDTAEIIATSEGK